MKRFITLGTLVCMFFLSLTAQEVELTIETTAGFLKDSISAEQRQTVTDLSLMGSMNDADFYLIRDDMPKLKILNLEHIEVDTIPEKAFYGHKSLMEVTLPAYVKYLSDQSFRSYYSLDIWISGMFPGLGEDVFGGARIDVLPENIFCKKNKECFYESDGITIRWECESILSFDGTKLYYSFSRSNLFYIPDGVETIESRSFDHAGIGTVIFRPSVRLIKKSAFSNIHLMVPNSGGEVGLRFDTVIPPILEENAFDDDLFAYFYLLVPKGSIDNYKNSDPQWMKFRIIDDESEITVIEKNTFNSIFTVTDDSGTSIISEEIISRIEITMISGITLVNREVGNRECLIPKTDVSGVCLVKLTLDNGSSTILKLNQ